MDGSSQLGSLITIGLAVCLVSGVLLGVLIVARKRRRQERGDELGPDEDRANVQWGRMDAAEPPGAVPAPVKAPGVAVAPELPELAPAADPGPGAAAPSLLGLRALMSGTAPASDAPASDAPDLALAPTQAAMARVAPAVETLPRADALAADAKDSPRAPRPGEAVAPSPRPTSGEAKPQEELVLADSDRSMRTLPASPPAIVEGLAEAETRRGRATPRTPVPVVGPSIGAYRLVRPSEPEVLTPHPRTSTPPPQRVRRPSGEVGRGEAGSTPRPKLSLGSRPGTGEPSAPRPRLPSGESSTEDVPEPKPRTPGPDGAPTGTILGIGRR